MEKSCLELSEEWNILPVNCEDKKKKMETEGDSIAKVIQRENDNPAKVTQVQDIAEHETACGSESSLSDIEIIDEDLAEEEELTNSCFISSIFTCSSSVEKDSDTCIGESVAFPEISSSISPDSEEIKDKPEDSESSNYCPKNGNADTDQSASPWIIFGTSLYDWIALFLEYLQNLSGFQWSCLFGLSMCLYFYMIINQTNIIAMHQKGNVSQMEKMFDELRNDNKLLKEQILSEIKNDKLVSSFEHQIRELKAENSKLNSTLYDVIKVLEKQKDCQEKLLEKKETDYQVPFKNESNKIKEHINMLKFDNEKLQKQLDQKRYASYSQSKHTDAKDGKEFGKDKHETNSEGDTKDEESRVTKKNECNAKVKKEFCTEASVDLKLLKKWNKVINQIIIKLRLWDKDKSEETVDVKSDSETEKDSYWSLKGFTRFINLSNVHMSELESKYQKSFEKVILKIYKSLSSFFYNAKDITQSFFEDSQTKEENSDKKSKLWNIIIDLRETLIQMNKKVLVFKIVRSFLVFHCCYHYFKKSNVHRNAHDGPNMKQKIIKITFDICHILFVMKVIHYLLDN